MIPKLRTLLLFTLAGLAFLVPQHSNAQTAAMIQDHGVTPNIEGVSAEHHNLSHHGRDPDKIKQLKIIETEILNCFGEFLSSIAAPSESGSRLLDQTSVLFGSNLGNANAHDPSNLPIILAGGNYKHGRYMKCGNGSDVRSAIYSSTCSTIRESKPIVLQRAPEDWKFHKPIWSFSNRLRLQNFCFDST